MSSFVTLMKRDVCRRIKLERTVENILFIKYKKRQGYTKYKYNVAVATLEKIGGYEIDTIFFSTHHKLLSLFVK